MKVLEEELGAGAEPDSLFEGGPRASGAGAAESRISSSVQRQPEEVAGGS